MGQPRHPDTVVYEMNRCLRNALFAYIRPRLVEQYGDGLDQKLKELFAKELPNRRAALGKLTGSQQATRQPIDLLDHLDINHCSVLFEKFWDDLSPVEDPNSMDAKACRKELLYHLGYVTQMRHSVAHPSVEPLSWHEVYRAVDRAHHVSQLLDLSDAKRELSETLAEVGRLLYGDGSHPGRSDSAHSDSELVSAGESADSGRALDDLMDLLEGGHAPEAFIELDLKARFRMGSEVTDGAVPPYVPRTMDGALRERIARGIDSAPEEWPSRLIIASGPPKAGKTRSMLEALRTTLPDALAVVRRPGASLSELAQGLEAADAA